MITMNHVNVNAFVATIVVIMIIALYLGGSILAWHTGYQAGQIDALTGKICYQLVESEKQERKWQYVDCTERNTND